MAATDGQIILAASRFGDIPPVYLRDFAKQQLPAIAKIIKGQHQNLGVPALSNPSLQSTALFLTAGKKYQILAQPIKIKEGRKPTNIGPKVLIPETYPGFFELLSEDGRSTRCIDTVLELSKRRNLRVLVRETFRCNHLNRTIHAGEILTTITDNGKFLQCKTVKDEILNLPLEAKAKFSPIAKEDSISGVHSVKNLLMKRMPVIVRLVHGSAPKGLKQPFVPELRLLGCVEVDRIFALPLQKDTDLISVPLNAKLKLQRAKNMEQLEHFIEYTRFLEKAQRLLSDARDRLQIVDLKLSEKEKKESKNSSSSRKIPLIISTSGLENGYVLRKSASCDSNNSKYHQQSSLNSIADEYDEIDHIYDYVRGLAPLSKSMNRFEPICESNLKSQPDSGNYSSLIRVNSNIQHIQPHYNHSHIEEDIKPVPPPIETIPGKKLPEKRQRPTLPKLYVKNSSSSSTNNHHHHVKITNGTSNGVNGVNSPIAAINGKESLEPQSPLFHIRYKSLSSLQLTPDSNSTTPISTTPKGTEKLVGHQLTKSASTGGAREGTLDSSRSGGRTSGDSKLPEKKTRRLSRPRSLSNLVWDLRPTKDKSKKKLYIHHFDHRQQGTLYL
ncbi:unnamed protein product [Hermetia illucens]|uniref:CABIT domain-containing protein n=1 Tax=Hermetia illucens TaxID=343691 RepID=A0A7R8V449_HERIL|nr:unnamed protein product [Hermetia illucens]